METADPSRLATRANPAQRCAIETTEGPLLIVAGPGSGKTFTLVERVVHLIRDEGAAPESLMVVTFTDKAAAELTTRISNRLDELGIQFHLNEMYLGRGASGNPTVFTAGEIVGVVDRQSCAKGPFARPPRTRGSGGFRTKTLSFASGACYRSIQS